MKKRSIFVLAAITLAFAVFVGGFYLGRMSNHSPIQTATLPQASAPPNTDPAGNPTDIRKININTASVQELTSLPGIGQILAQRIVDHRSKYGPFDAIGELANVEGIGLQKLEAIWQYITI